MTGPLMIPRDNYSCDIVRGVPGISGVITIYSASSSCLRRTVRGAGPSGEAGGVRVQRSASEHWPVEHLHGEVSRDLDADTLMSTLQCFSYHLTKTRPVVSGSRRGSADTEEAQQRVARIQLTKEHGGGLGLSIGNDNL